MVELFTTGGILLDTIVAADGTVHADGLGGNAVYSAAGARLWAGRVGCVGVVPRNFPGRWISLLDAAGINVGGVHRVDTDVDGTEWFFHRADGSRVDQLHAGTELLSGGRLPPDEARSLEQRLRSKNAGVRGFGAFRNAHPVEPAHVPAEFWRGGGVHLAPNRTDAQHRLMYSARDNGLAVSLDPGRHAATMTGQDVAAFLLGCDVFLPSEKELRILVPGEDLTEAVRLLSGRGAALVAGKLGPAGSVVMDRRTGIAVLVPALPIRAPDPTGAGDAYCGGFLAAWLRTRDPVLAACCGTISASFAVEAFGPGTLLAASAAEASARLRWVGAQVPDAASKPGLDTLMMERMA